MVRLGDTRDRPIESATLVLSWTETHEWKVALSTSATDRMAAGFDALRAAETAIAQSGLWQRTGLVLPSVQFRID
jgi:hypothetical protein